MKKPTTMPLMGKVASKKCPTCGHHAIGVMTGDGHFHPLIPGSWVQVFSTSPLQETCQAHAGPTYSDDDGQKTTDADWRIWFPEPVKANKQLRLKYGVRIPADTERGLIDVPLYRAAFLQKLESLIAREGTPVAIILDRYFNAPHLASGNPRQIALSMWKELEEIRIPIQVMARWLGHRNEEGFREPAGSGGKKDLGGVPPSPDEIRHEFETLTLQDFLSFLQSAP